MSSERDPGNERASGPVTDPARLVALQYRDEANLRARASLHERYDRGEPWQRWVFELLPDASGLDVLELGCGPGRLWSENAGRVPASWRLTLTDLSPGMLDAARTALEAAGLRARFEALEATELARDGRFAAGAFDLAIANHMLYHVPDPDAAVAAVRRALRPGGRFFAATNGREHLLELFELIRDELPPGGATLPGRLAFDLESGGDILGRHFADVRLHPRRDRLRVTDPEAVVAYAASMAGVAGRAPERLAPEVRAALGRVRDRVAARVEREGAFVVRRETGVFEAL